MNVGNAQLSPPPAGTYEIPVPKYKLPGEPEHYRLSAGRLGAARREPPTALVHFWFRTRYVSAFAADLSNLHPHIFKLHIRPSIVARVIGSCVGLLPAFAQSWIRTTALPEWFLPDHVVVKQQRQAKEMDEEEIMAEHFDNEVRAYRRLKPLQGVVVPTCYGRLNYYGTRALLLEYLDGVSLSDPEGATLRLEELSNLLQPCYRALLALDVSHEDPNLSNFQLVNGKIMVMDLEEVEYGLSADDKVHAMVMNIRELAGRYRSMQAYYRHDGSLEADEE
ncbi:hypothetical protein B0T19DRAFT_410940 [Cercophora scortea]|uniref:Uncharacterized protein n=1 Tax=Cercophora scortea TaxID=314031 RepID=A0AAE0J4Q5_9PEZI|nr:hypothetical protein B0T19DRAFT_410940 [Cercophora scortea]